MRVSPLVATALTLGICLVGCAGGPLAWAYPGYKVTIRVVDESGAPVEGADAGASFPRMKTMNPFDGQTSVHEESQTNAKGECILRGRGLPEVYLGAEKAGYYESRKTVTFGPDPETKKDSDSAVVVLCLRKKISPTAMYAKRLEYQPIPVLDRPVGFDLLAGDWVMPYGKGITSDVVFTGKLDVRSREDFDAALLLQFPNPGDGLAVVPAQRVFPESKLLLPYEAPENGFDLREIRWTCNEPRDRYVPQCTVRGVNWFLRVRTELDRDGRAVKAMYGKIPGEIALMVTVNPHPAISISFTYYVNPDGTRNIEFDPKRNLIPNARSYEKPTKP